jgi:hypothetical protein
MDTDSFMPKELAYDPIALAHRRGLKYLGRAVGLDDGAACRGMWDFVEEYTDAHPGLADRMARNDVPIPDPSPDRIEAAMPAWYNNFEVVHVPSFHRPEVAEWLKTLNKFWRGFYVHRWGESGSRSARYEILESNRTESKLTEKQATPVCGDSPSPCSSSRRKSASSAPGTISIGYVLRTVWFFQARQMDFRADIGAGRTVRGHVRPRSGHSLAKLFSSVNGARYSVLV